MKKVTTTVLVIGLVFSFIIAGCGVKKAKTTREAVQYARSMKGTDQDKMEYLVSQAEAFYRTRDSTGDDARVRTLQVTIWAWSRLLRHYSVQVKVRWPVTRVPLAS